MSCRKQSNEPLMRADNPARLERTIVVGLAGQPNVGKSTIFNLLTGLSQHVGNWPGKTVERKEGVLVRDLINVPARGVVLSISPAGPGLPAPSGITSPCAAPVS